MSLPDARASSGSNDVADAAALWVYTFAGRTQTRWVPTLRFGYRAAFPRTAEASQNGIPASRTTEIDQQLRLDVRPQSFFGVKQNLSKYNQRAKDHLKKI